VARVDANAKRIEAKLVYAGPAGSGKRTNLAKLEEEIPGANRLRPGSLDLDEKADERFLIVSLGEMKGYTPAFLVRALPDDAAGREACLLTQDGLTPDGIVFVADSDPGQAAANQAAMAELTATLAKASLSLDSIPVAFQWNKRDVGGASALDALRALNAGKKPEIEAVAAKGTGVKESFQAVAKQILVQLRK
jgi:signal recognition particle receptor subunit beta